MSAVNIEEYEQLNGLAPEEREAVLSVLKELAEKGYSDKYNELLYSDYDEVPVDIETFMFDKRFLGNGLVDAEGRRTVFPFWVETLKKIFPTNVDTAYNTVVFTGAIGIGKSFIAVICQLYLMYRMLCLKDPYLYYGMQPIDKISFAQINITLDAAKGVAWDKMQQLLQSSPWFMAHGHLVGKDELVWKPAKKPGQIGTVELVVGSKNSHIIGRAVFCLDGDTEIVTTDGVDKIKNLVGKDIRVISVDADGNKVISDSCKVEPTSLSTEEYAIELEDGTVIKCTPNHKFLLKDGTYKEARYLTEQDELADITGMSYFDFIDSIIRTRGQWNIPKGEYWEGHHIIPKCMGGEGRAKNKHSNIIRLYPEEHYLAHKLLALENPENMALVSAWEMMIHPKGKTKRSYEISAEDYAIARKLWSRHMTEHNPGLKNGHPWNYGTRKPKKPKEKKIGSGVKGKMAITDGHVTKFINKDDIIPDGFKIGSHTKGRKKTYKDLESYGRSVSLRTSGNLNPMYGKGYKLSGGNNGHATIRYFYGGDTFECRKDLLPVLKAKDARISTSTIRKLIGGSARVLREHPILREVSWEVK